jgi:hypothetical protein
MVMVYMVKKIKRFRGEEQIKIIVRGMKLRDWWSKKFLRWP